MQRCAVFIDAGYYCVAAARLVAGRRSRREVVLDLPLAVQSLASLGCVLCEPAQLLRTYWYDASPTGLPSSWHNSLANQANVKLRLGQLRGQPARQKGVDTLIVLDLVVLAQERSISDAVLVAGDEDLRHAVAYAQERGVRVHLVVADNCPASWTLRHEADTVTSLMADHFAPFARPARDASG